MKIAYEKTIRYEIGDRNRMKIQGRETEKRGGREGKGRKVKERKGNQRFGNKN